MGAIAEGDDVKRRMRLCRQRSENSSNTRITSGKTDAVPGFPWPPPLLAELREIFRMPVKPKPVEPPKKPEVM